jgi:hypothetical protein
MKKSILALSAFAAILTMSCTGQADKETQPVQLADTVEQVEVQEITGVAVDGAMNSVYLKVGDDTIEFSYPDLEGENRASWAINDTLTVRYITTADGDSVTAVINDTDA